MQVRRKEDDMDTYIAKKRKQMKEREIPDYFLYMRRRKESVDNVGFCCFLLLCTLLFFIYSGEIEIDFIIP